MGVLRIDCYCSESQMLNALKAVTRHIKNMDIRYLEDYDDVIDDIRISVEFDYIKELTIKSAEISDIDWTPIEEDTAVFKSRLKAVLRDFNRELKEAIVQAKYIREDELEIILQ